MSVVPESQASKTRSQLEEYRVKFPEIPEQDLLRIVQKYASDPENCEKMLEVESNKGLYGSPSTPDPPSPVKLPIGPRNRIENTPPFPLPRSNSTGSAGSSDTSGRSTPVNPIPTPWVVPPRYPVPTLPAQVVPPGGYPTSVLPPGTVCINGNYYQPVKIPNTSQISPIDKPQVGGQSSSEGKQISPNAGYSLYNTNDYFTSATGRSTPTSMVSSQATGPGVATPTGYFTPASQPQSYPVASRIDQRYHTLPGSSTSTPNLPTNTDYRPLISTSHPGPALLNTDEMRLSNVSPNPRFSTTPIGSSGSASLKPLYVSTSPAANSPELTRKWSNSSGSPEELRRTLVGGKRQPVANDDYLRACFSHQQKRFQKLHKEYLVEKERLEILIKEISERDGALYERRYVIAPNPTDEQVAALRVSIEKLKRHIDDISRNIDRLDNGQMFLPPADPRLHDPQRIPSPSRHRDTFDRSNSVPCLRPEQGRVLPPPLTRPLSEHDMNRVVQLDRDRVSYQINPPADPTLQDWNFVNPEPEPPSLGDEETQWSCVRCTFLNHDSLTVCEMCGSSRQP